MEKRQSQKQGLEFLGRGKDVRTYQQGQHKETNVSAFA
jgi:hypothetical protein